MLGYRYGDQHSFSFDTAAAIVITITEGDWSMHVYWFSYRCGYLQCNHYDFSFNILAYVTIVMEEDPATGKTIGTLLIKISSLSFIVGVRSINR